MKKMEEYMVIEKIIFGKKITIYTVDWYYTKGEFGILIEKFPNIMKKLVDNGFNKFVIHETYNEKIPIKLNDRFCFLYSKSPSFEKFVETIHMNLVHHEENYEQSTEGLCLDYIFTSTISGDIRLTKGTEIIGDITPYSIHTIDFWHYSDDPKSAKNADIYIDKMLELYNENMKEVNLDIYEMLKEIKNIEFFEIKIKTNKEKLRNSLISKKISSLEKYIKRIERYYNNEIKKIPEICNEHISGILENILSKYKIVFNKQYGWSIEVEIVPELIVKDGKMYKIKEEIKEKYKISGITIFDKKAYTINKTLHPNVSKDTTRHGYKICTGRFDATFLSIEDIINMLKTINLDSAYRDIEESLSDIAVETERKETVWSDSW